MSYYLFSLWSIGRYTLPILLSTFFVNKIKRIPWTLKNNVWLAILCVRYRDGILYSPLKVRPIVSTQVNLLDNWYAIKVIRKDMRMALRFFCTRPDSVRKCHLWEDVKHTCLTFYLIFKSEYPAYFSIWFKILILYAFCELWILTRPSISS